MEARQLLGILDRLIDEARVAILTNISHDSYPLARWMSPALVRGQEGFIYAVTSPEFAKTSDLTKNPKVSWMVQTKALDEIISVRGQMKILSDPGLQSMVLEAIGGKLGTFWKLNQDSSKVVVLETEIESLEYFKPSQGIKEKALFGGSK